jgi:hypothetical protein
MPDDSETKRILGPATAKEVEALKSAPSNSSPDNNAVEPLDFSEMF